MALIKCNECGANVSEKSSACMKCGNPMSEILREMKIQKQKKQKKMAHHQNVWNKKLA